MGESNILKKILSIFTILVLLAALAGLIWYERQLAMKTSQIEESYQATLNQEGEQASKEESQGFDGEEEINSEIRKDFNQSVLAGLEAKESISEFVSQEGQITLRSLGNVSSPFALTQLADNQSQAYKDQIAMLQEAGLDISASAVSAYDYAPMLQQIKPFTSYADLTMANLSLPVAYPQLPLLEDQLNAPSELLLSLKDIGVDLVSNANTHVLDQGRPGLVATLNNLESVSLVSVGLYTDDQDRNEGRIIEMNGIRLGFLSYTYNLNGNVLEEGREYLVGLADLPTMEAEIQALAEQVDAVVVSLNLSDEATEEPGQEQRDIYQALSLAGARLILGNNQNAVQSAEWLNDKQTFAVYSQGNFLSGANDLDERLGLILDITFKKDNQGLVTLETPKLMPNFLAWDPEGAYLQVVPLADYQLFKINQGQDFWTKFKEKMTTYSEDVQILSHLETKGTFEAEEIYR